MNKGFAYIAVLGVLVLMTILSFFLIRLFMSHEEVKVAWQKLDQASLNCSSAANHFFQSQNGFTANPEVQHFEFVPENGFSYRVLPLGLYWLLEITGFRDQQRVTVRQILGSSVPNEPVLALAQKMSEVFLADTAQIQGSVIFAPLPDQEFIDDHPLAPQSRIEAIAGFSRRGLAAHLQAPFQADWRMKLTGFFPDLEWRDAGGVLDLSQLAPQSELLVIKGQHLQIRGEYQYQTPLFLLIEGDLVASEGIALNTCWAMVKGDIRLQRNTRGHQVHLLGRRIEMLGDLDFQASSLTAVSWANQESANANIRLAGRGRFQGAITAVATKGQLADDLGWQQPGRAHISVDRLVDTEGVIYCDGSVTLRGNHTGSVRADQWNFQDGDASFPGRLADLTLTGNRENPSVWGQSNSRGESLFFWGVRGDDQQTAQP